jgi:hypothetical protein
MENIASILNFDLREIYSALFVPINAVLAQFLPAQHLLFPAAGMLQGDHAVGAGETRVYRRDHYRHIRQIPFAKHVLYRLDIG